MHINVHTFLSGVSLNLILELPFDVIEDLRVTDIVQVIGLDFQVSPLELHFEGTFGRSVDHLFLCFGVFRSVRDEEDLGPGMTTRRLVVVIQNRVSD